MEILGCNFPKPPPPSHPCPTIRFSIQMLKKYIMCIFLSSTMRKWQWWQRWENVWTDHRPWLSFFKSSYLKSAAILRLDRDGSQTSGRMKGSVNKVNKASMPVNPLVLQHPSLLVHMLQKVCPQDGSQREARFQMRKKSSRTHCNVSGQIQGLDRAAKLSNHTRIRVKKKVVFRQSSCSKKRKWIKGTQHVMNGEWLYTERKPKF